MADASKQPMKAPFPIDDVATTSLDLDLRNSRFPRDAQSQQDALELMLNTAGEDCIAMMRDITQSGQLNSSDIPIVIRKSDRHLVMEGNRRLTCIKIWHDIELLSADPDIRREYKSRFERLIQASPYEPPTKLRVTIAPTEADADHWIDRKHESGAGGAGTVQWGPAMKDRRLARNNPSGASRALAFTALVSAEFVNDHDIIADLEEVRTKRYSMLQRLVDRSVVRDLLGLNFANGTMTFKHGPDATRAAIRAILADFARPKADSGKTWARELDTVEDFRNYLMAKNDLLPGGTGGSNVTPPMPSGTERRSPLPDSATRGSGSPEETGTTRPQAASGGTEATTRPPRPAPPSTFIFRGIVLHDFTNRIQEVVRQTSLLNINTNSEVTAVLLRVILDLTTQQFLKSHGKNPEKFLDKNIRTAIKIIDPTASDALGQAESTPPLRKAFHETTPDSVRLIQYAVHDMHSGRTPAETKTLADRYEPVLIAMNENMGSNPLR